MISGSGLPIEGRANEASESDESHVIGWRLVAGGIRK